MATAKKATKAKPKASGAGTMAEKARDAPLKGRGTKKAATKGGTRAR